MSPSYLAKRAGVLLVVVFELPMTTIVMHSGAVSMKIKRTRCDTFVAKPAFHADAIVITPVAAIVTVRCQ